MGWFEKQLLDPGNAAGALAGAFGAVDAVFNPAADRARELIDAQNEHVVQTPSAGDDLLRNGRLVIKVEGGR